MKGNIQLRISTPCSESWEKMRPEENGRHCGVCSKTVVDFSMMSDREIIAYLSRAGQHVCGRMAAGQLRREMFLRPDAANPRQWWWKWLLAGLLISSEANAQRTPVATVTASPPKKTTQDKPLLQGPMAISRVLPDSIPVNEMPPGIVQQVPAVENEVIYVGGLIARHHRRARRVPNAIVDTAAKLIRDTLNMMNFLPKKEWNVYPNPVRKGAALMLTWPGAEAGSYEVGLFDTEGRLLRQRVLEVTSRDQVDLLDIPASLAPGTYILRGTLSGKGKTLTRTLVVL